jgi:hypothetical protein
VQGGDLLPSAKPKREWSVKTVLGVSGGRGGEGGSTLRPMVLPWRRPSWQRTENAWSRQIRGGGGDLVAVNDVDRLSNEDVAEDRKGRVESWKSHLPG